MKDVNKLKQLEIISQRLEPNSEERKEWLLKIIDYTEEFLEDLPDKKVYIGPNQKKKTQIQIQSIAEASTPIEELLKHLKEVVDREGINPASGHHLGYVPGGGIYSSALGDFLAAVTNRYVGVHFASPGGVDIENQMIKWLCDLVGYPDSASGSLASGGSIASLTALASAREKFNIKPENIRNHVIYLSDQLHHCLIKAIRILGLNYALIRNIPLDSDFKMDAKALEDQVESDLKNDLIPFLIIGSAGTTDTGAIDPLERLADLSAKYSIWLHIDAAYGGTFLLLDDLKSKFVGLDRADSIVIDPHKGLFLSYGLGALIIRNPEYALKAHLYTANYMQDAVRDPSQFNPADLSPELSKHFRGLRMWLSLKLFGLEPFKAALKEKILLTQYCLEKIECLGAEIGQYTGLSVGIFRFLDPVGENDDRHNQRIQDKFLNDGRVFISTTTIEGVYWLRICILNFRTHKKEVDLFLKMLESFIHEKVN